MLISKNWLQDFVKIPKIITPEKMAADLTMKTVEVEAVKSLSKDFDNLVAGCVRSIVKHPDADNLQVCKVYLGESKEEYMSDEKELQVVCGGSNLQEGMTVALGKIGAKVRWHGEGEPIELKKVKIRGVDSFGMICASDEIGLHEMFPKKEEKEIMDISHLNIAAGTPLIAALGLGDVVFDIDNKSMTHRPDLWGHYGIARELSVFYNQKLKPYEPPKIKGGRKMKLEVAVEDKKLCPRYMGVIIEGIKIAPSPDWMQKRLAAIGVRLINNIVDITNYIMFELGQPMHAFDAKFIAGTGEENKKNIIVKRARSAEKFVTLDGKEHLLTNDMLVISDNKKTLALAGIMGGENSGINDSTTSIIFESANFDASNIRKTSTALNLRTDSSTRFEKGLDPNSAELALERAVELVMAICPEAKVVSKVCDENNFKLSKKPIKISLDFIAKKIGAEIDKKEIVSILEQLGFEVNTQVGRLSVRPPSWRAIKDIVIAEDVAEEIARLHGYDNIKSALPHFSISLPAENKLRKLKKELKNILAYEFGFSEVYNYSFVSPELLNKIGEKKDNYIELNNPIANDRPLVRRHLFPNLLKNAEENLHRFEAVKLFEVGKIYLLEEFGEQAGFGSEERLPNQDTVLGMICAQKGVAAPFYEISESIAGALHRLGLVVKFQTNESVKKDFLHSGRVAELVVNNSSVGFLGELHPFAQERLGIPHRVAMLELRLNKLIPFLHDMTGYDELSDYPSIDRDLAFVVGRETEHNKIVDEIKKIDKLICTVELFDMYEGKQVRYGGKSMAYHLVYQSNEKTLEAKEVDLIHKKVIDMLEKKFGAAVRK